VLVCSRIVLGGSKFESRRRGARITTAASVREAMAALKRQAPHVLVSDLGMPDEDGLDLIRWVRGAGHTAEQLPRRGIDSLHEQGARAQRAAGRLSDSRPKTGRSRLSGRGSRQPNCATLILECRAAPTPGESHELELERVQTPSASFESLRWLERRQEFVLREDAVVVGIGRLEIGSDGRLCLRFSLGQFAGMTRVQLSNIAPTSTDGAADDGVCCMDVLAGGGAFGGGGV